MHDDLPSDVELAIIGILMAASLIGDDLDSGEDFELWCRSWDILLSDWNRATEKTGMDRPS